MGHIRFGCQFYTWQMSGGKYVGRLPHILSVVQHARFSGIEPETCMLGSYNDDPVALKDALAEHGLALGALVLVCEWQAMLETPEERREAERVLGYLRHFPGTHLVLCQMPGADRANLRERQQNAIGCVNAVGRRASLQGISCSFHPNSPPASLFRTEEDYRILLDGLDGEVVGFCPDSGHIARGGMDVLSIFRTYRPLIRHVHFKDMNVTGEWAAMGQGGINFPSIVTFLRDTEFDGWVMIEEESVAAEADPDGATQANGKYVTQHLVPLLPRVL